MTLYYEENGITIYYGDALTTLRDLPDESVQCCVTSPPYWGLRDYGGWQMYKVWDGGWCDYPRPRRVSRARVHSLRLLTRAARRGYIYAPNGKTILCAYGLEPTPDLYVSHAVQIFREVRRVLKSDGTLWLNMGDSYATGAGKVGNCPGGGDQGKRWRDPTLGYRGDHVDPKASAKGPKMQPNRMPIAGLKPKDLIGIPWRVAFALQADGWYLRSDIIEEVEIFCPYCGGHLEERIWRYGQDREIIWKKPNPMPESVKDRPTRAHEYIFLLTKSGRYYYDAAAIMEDCLVGDNGSSFTSVYDIATKPGLGTKPRKVKVPAGWDTDPGTHGGFHRKGRGKPQYTTTGKWSQEHLQSSGRRMVESVKQARVNGGGHDSCFGAKRNKRSVWTIPTVPYKEAHFATFPPNLIKPCVLAGTRPGDTVLDPFAGVLTTAYVAKELSRRAIMIELNAEYIDIGKKRLAQGVLQL